MPFNYSDELKAAQVKVDQFNKDYKQGDNTPYGILAGTAYTYVAKAWVHIVGVAEPIELI